MGLLDGLLGGLAGQAEGGGSSSDLVGALLGGATGGQGGGNLTGVLETLAANGLSEHVASWVGDGHNLPVSTDQIREALGSEQVQQLAASSGLPVGESKLGDGKLAAAPTAANSHRQAPCRGRSVGGEKIAIICKNPQKRE